MSFLKYVSALTILGALSVSVPARADVPPDNECFAADVGEPCSNAIINGFQAQGVCRETTCSRATPEGPMTFDCTLCLGPNQGNGGRSNEGGTGGSAGEPSGGGGSAGGGASPGGSPSSNAGSGTAGSATAGAQTSPGNAGDAKSGSDDGGGCSVSQARGGAGALGVALAVLGFAFAGLARRRSPRI